MTAPKKRNDMSESVETEMIETKAASGDSPVITSTGATGDDVANAFDDFMRAFESFKAENNDRRSTCCRPRSSTASTVRSMSTRRWSTSSR
jgi:hypothetical protein